MLRNIRSLINTDNFNLGFFFREIWVANLENGLVRNPSKNTLFVGSSLPYYFSAINLFQLFKNVVFVRGKVIYMLGFGVRDFLHRKGFYYTAALGAFGGFSYAGAANPYTPDVESFFSGFFVQGMRTRSGIVLNTSYFSGTVSAGQFFRRTDSVVAGICQKKSGFDFPFIINFRSANIEKMFFNYFFCLQQSIRTPTRFTTLLVNNFVANEEILLNSDLSTSESESDVDENATLSPLRENFSVVNFSSLSQVFLTENNSLLAFNNQQKGRDDVFYFFSLVVFSNGATTLMCTSLFRYAVVIANDWYSKNLWFILDQPKQYINFMRFIRKYGQGKIFDDETKKNNERALT